MRHTIFFCLGAVCLIAALLVYIYDRMQHKKIMKHLNEMIDTAYSGTFTETHFDESMVSQVEAKLANYLSASEVSAKNLQGEKDSIKQLIADISHQTKTPIANILLYTDLLMEQELSKEGSECASQIKRQSEKLNFLIQSLVKASRLETGILILNPIKQSIAPMLMDVFEEVKLKAQKAGVKIHLSYDKDQTAVFDKKWTTEAVYNIMDNAIKYTPEGGKILLETVESDLFLRIDISDNGIGIREGEQAQVFQRFYRSPVVNSYEGIGIGLFLAREIITKQGGYIKLSSKEGVGSRFSVFLEKE